MSAEVKLDQNVDEDLSKSNAGRIAKDKKYHNEQKNILKQIITILGLTKEKNSFAIDEFEKNLDKHQQIIALIPNIKEYFNYSKWQYFLKESTKTPLSLIKSILKQQGVKTNMVYEKDDSNVAITSKSMKLKLDGVL